MTTYQLGESPRIEATITATATGAAADPSTVLISIEKPDGVLAVDGIAMTNSAVGSYYYDHTIPAETTGQIGTYKYKIVATGSGGRVTIAIGTFKAEASI